MATQNATAADEATLVSIFLKEKQKANWGDNNPKLTGYTAVELALTDSEKVSGDGPKGISAIKSLAKGTHTQFVFISRS
jgi:hypothetical protein